MQVTCQVNDKICQVNCTCTLNCVPFGDALSLLNSICISMISTLYEHYIMYTYLCLYYAQDYCVYMYKYTILTCQVIPLLYIYGKYYLYILSVL